MLHAQVMPDLNHLYQVVCPAVAVADADLLARFLTRRDEAAFELLVRRHGPMVLGVCGRVLRSPADVEDAFQATFLMLVCKGGRIGKRASVGSWLYKVAHRLALRAQLIAAKRSVRERSLSLLPFEPAESSQDASAWRELRPILDAEVSRLPEPYRAPFVLCCLEGKTNSEAAEELGCPRGTIDSRLARARQRLRDRLARRGVMLGGFALFALIAEQSARLAEASPVLVNATVHGAVLWSLKGMAGIANASSGAAKLLAAEAKARLRKVSWLATGFVALLVLVYFSWVGFTHGASTDLLNVHSGGGCHSR